MSRNQKLERKVERARWRDWYNRRADEYNEKRRQRYQDDERYRQEVKERARDYKREKYGRLGDGRVQKELKGKRVICVRVSAVAEKAGVKPATIAKLHRQGVIPDCLFEGYRLYTPNQVKLLVKFLTAWRKSESKAAREALVEKWVVIFSEKWEK